MADSDPPSYNKPWVVSRTRFIPPCDDDYERRVQLWGMVDKPAFINPYVVGPFEMILPDCIPDQLVMSRLSVIPANTEGLALMEVLGGSSLKLTFTEDRRLIFGFQEGCGPDTSWCRDYFVNCWAYVYDWVTEVLHGSGRSMYERALERAANEPLDFELEDP
ncbi:hypothetical protein F53441_12312 [Fusarium austroafricanum]|uniref:Uncharacterized protein n=1 Tax=Fusarium austroafricanum TaxID=2364996 RepID=A0A8H4K0L0_9HYPO|nr:hypothetical protein F53441_12312 [Fusarium austroafricanum]